MRLFFTLISYVYGFIISIRNLFFDIKIFKSESYKIPIIGIGNLSIGGTGKTPHVEYIINLLKIKYRGPNNLSVKKYDNSIIIGHLRLSIIDLDKRSNQPYEFEKLVITYNGEIYNYLELREKLKSLGYTFNTESDTEVILKGFHAWGTELLPKMNGMFAFAIYDSINKKVFCARDRLGQKPFYYYWDKGFLELCSSPKPMEKASKISQKAVSIYLETGYIPSPYSIYENVKKLEAGTFVVFDLKNQKYTEKIY